jgi:hypothetical protein
MGARSSSLLHRTGLALAGPVYGHRLSPCGGRCPASGVLRVEAVAQRRRSSTAIGRLP